MSSARFKPEWLESRTAGMCCIQTNKCRVAMQVVSSAKGGEENTRLRAVYAIANLAGNLHGLNGATHLGHHLWETVVWRPV